MNLPPNEKEKIHEMYKYIFGSLVRWQDNNHQRWRTAVRDVFVAAHEHRKLENGRPAHFGFICQSELRIFDC
jgi:hypothetical protein